MPGQDWKSLGNAVAGKRYKMGYRDARSFAQAAGLSERTIGRLENGHQMGRNTLIAVEAFFGWPTGTTDRILAGGESPDATVASKKSAGPDLRDDVERKLWAALMAIEELAEEERLLYLDIHRSQKQRAANSRGQTG